MLKRIKKFIFKQELEDIKTIDKSFNTICHEIIEIQEISKIKSIALDLAYQEIAQRTGDSKELVRERIVDMAIENYDPEQLVYGIDNPNEMDLELFRLNPHK